MCQIACKILMKAVSHNQIIFNVPQWQKYLPAKSKNEQLMSVSDVSHLLLVDRATAVSKLSARLLSICC